MVLAELYPSVRAVSEVLAILWVRAVVVPHDPHWSLTAISPWIFARSTVPRLDAPIGTAFGVRNRARA